ncbi:MAG: hypothetical protein GTO55_00060 [Armatimonadetes bacterium]|nr:hypothetical protein [Armatimonadota bacterium]NIM22729.1 hypothetical protein [Armatimonadota bacterium]NIM66559.1 hypothetical protein [Armatimonadota bacterium]NIM75095.1 hypothetical protein [Armatimonadota bacterium]NIN04779.1 hypothetical protein [Armatimonadota bacterium]
MRFIYLLRYRFFVWAGLLPYLLGSAAAFHFFPSFPLRVFLAGLAGVVLALIAVEAFNESFESGTDTLFSLQSSRCAPKWMLPLAAVALAGAGGIGLCLALTRGWPILAFAALGALAVAFYVGPPIRWAYRGAGETVIALSYGPLMICGAYYLHTRSLDARPLLISLAPAFLIAALAVINEIPDYYQDRLVGKRNLVVRLGRERTARLFALLLVLAYVSLAIAVITRAVPTLAWLFLFTYPLAFLAARRAIENCERPQKILSPIRTAILLFLICNLFLTLLYLC